ncbi:MAG: recombinase family protein [Oscillospiraceae bacterium]|nr:recombinase family protein [Oscillospiraceae bacterium]
MSIYGYVRTSTTEQHEDRQMIAMAEHGVLAPQIYMDKLSGKDFERPRYKALLRKLRPGDVLYIKSIDRLGRNYTEIIEQWRIITKEKRADVIVLDMPLLNTHINRDLTGTLIADIVLQLLSYVATVELENIRTRQAEGIAAAKARGVKFGRPPKKRPPEFANIRAAWAFGQISAREAARSLGITHRTFLNWAREN